MPRGMHHVTARLTRLMRRCWGGASAVELIQLHRQRAHRPPVLGRSEGKPKGQVMNL